MSQIVLPARDSELACLVKSLRRHDYGGRGPTARALLAHDRAAQRYYVAYMDVHVQTQWLHRGGRRAGRGRDEPSPLAGPPATPLTDVPADGVPSDAGPAPIHPTDVGLGSGFLGKPGDFLHHGRTAFGLGIFAAATWQSAGRCRPRAAAARAR